MKNIKIFCSKKENAFTEVICRQLQIPLGLCQTKYFPNGEILFQLNEDVQQNHVIILKRFSELIHQDAWELLQMVNRIHQMLAKNITVILPYLPYTRQHHYHSTNNSASIPLLIELLKHAGVDIILTIDMHAPEQCLHWPVPVLNISIEPFWINHLQSLNLDWANSCIFGADKSAAHRAETIAKHFNCDWGYLDKKRDHEGAVSIQGMHGNCHNKHILLMDDLIDTGNTLSQSAQYLKDSGAIEISAFVTHCLFNHSIENLMNHASIHQLTTANTTLVATPCQNCRFLPIHTLLSENILKEFA